MGDVDAAGEGEVIAVELGVEGEGREGERAEGGEVDGLVEGLVDGECGWREGVGVDLLVDEVFEVLVLG